MREKQKLKRISLKRINVNVIGIEIEIHRLNNSYMKKVIVVI